MVCRGLWNFHIDGKWYRLCHPRGRISPPDDTSTFQLIQQLHENPDTIKRRDIIPFPSPLHSNLDYVYTIDQDADTFIISLWKEQNEILIPAAISINLASVYESSGLIIKSSLVQPSYISPDAGICETCTTPLTSQEVKMLSRDHSLPTPMNELQERFFTDFIFLWRFYIDDPLTWRYSSNVFRGFCIALLRLAGWDFEVSFDYNPDLPIYFASIPGWHYPMENIYWFHGFLIVLQEDIQSEDLITKAVTRAKSFLDSSLGDRTVHLILISPHQIAFAQLSRDAFLASKCLTLLSNHSATQCSPGFRALSRVLTSDCWKKPRAHLEQWKRALPPEILQQIISQSESRDAISFSRASLAVQQCYFATIPRFNDMIVRGYKSSIPCCGKRGGLEQHGVCCSNCYSWQHLECVGTTGSISKDRYLCLNCKETISSMTLDPGGINRSSCRQRREVFPVKVGHDEKFLHLRVSKPSHLRPELRFLGNTVSVPPRLVEYTILFNGSFSGFAYGLEDTRN